MGMISVIAKADCGFSHLYGEITKGSRYLIDEEHFDKNIYRKAPAVLPDETVPEITMVAEPAVSPERDETTIERSV